MRIGFWIKNARNIALPQSLLPCLTAIVLCIGEEGFVWWLAIPVILGVCAAHLGMNLADDYFDYKHDSRTRADISSTSIRARMEKCHYLEPSPALPKGGSEIAAKAAVDGRSAAPVDGRVAHYDMRWLKPMDEQLLHEIGKRFTTIITVEDGVISGGLGSAVLEFMADNGYTPRVIRLGVNDQFVEHGSTKELYHLLKLDKEGICESLLQALEQ
jgi:hypothetical protein